MNMVDTSVFVFGNKLIRLLKKNTRKINKANPSVSTGVPFQRQQYYSYDVSRIPPIVSLINSSVI